MGVHNHIDISFVRAPRCFLPALPHADAAPSGLLPATTAKLQTFSLQDAKGVIIPGHLQASQADQARLSFGSFGTGFSAGPFSTTFGGRSTVVAKPGRWAEPV